MKRETIFTAAAVLAAAGTLVLAPTASAQDWGSSGSAGAPAPAPPAPSYTPTYPVARYVACADSNVGWFKLYRDGNGDMTGENWTTLPSYENGRYCGYHDEVMYDSHSANALLGSFEVPGNNSDYTHFSIYLNGVLQCSDTNDYGYAYCANY